MFINACDMARFGYLFLRNGKWKDRQIVSEKWIQMARTPGPANAEYGYMNWFLNTGEEAAARGARVERHLPRQRPEHHLRRLAERSVVVVRWINTGPALNEFIGRVLSSIRPARTSAPTQTCRIAQRQDSKNSIGGVSVLPRFSKRTAGDACRQWQDPDRSVVAAPGTGPSRSTSRRAIARRRPA